MLWPRESRQRRFDFFNYQGGTIMDVMWGLHLIFANHPRKATEECDTILIFLTRHARMSAEWVMEQDFDRLEELIEAVKKIAKAERGGPPTPGDTVRDMPLGR